MNRRQFLVATGSVAAVGTAGCLGGDGEYPTEEFDGVDVPLAPIDDVYDWYESEEARFADARGRNQYEHAHIEGAVHSPAPDGGENDPVAEWGADEQIVTYCGCPHHLSGLRASSLISNGYENVYALDEGFGAWVEEEYPLEGNGVAADLPAYEVRGRSDPSYEGEYVWVRDAERDQVEIAPIDADGEYEMTLHFVGLTDDSVLSLEAPDYALEATLSELTSDVVTG